VRLAITAAALLIFAATAPAFGQAARRAGAPVRAQDRFYAGVDFGVQSGGESFSDAFTFPANAETARIAAPYETKSGPLLGFFFDVRVWKYLSAGISFTGHAPESDTQVTGTIPHPFFFNRPRSLSGDVSGLERGESGMHFQIRALLPVSRNPQVSVFGGPSFFQVDQDLATGVHWTETYPYDSVSFTSAMTETRSESGTGFNIGADVGYFMSRHFGVGGRVQYASATVDFPSASGTGSVQSKVGGLQAGGGLRVRF
jgi:hypothetical protein